MCRSVVVGTLIGSRRISSLERMSCKTKIYFTLFQLLSSLPFVLRLSFPFYSSIISFGSIQNLFDDVALSCDYEVDDLIMVTVVPTGVEDIRWCWRWRKWK